MNTHLVLADEVDVAEVEDGRQDAEEALLLLVVDAELCEAPLDVLVARRVLGDVSRAGRRSQAVRQIVPLGLREREKKT
jgi:hypothetical protein